MCKQQRQRQQISKIRSIRVQTKIHTDATNTEKLKKKHTHIYTKSFIHIHVFNNNKGTTENKKKIVRIHNCGYGQMWTQKRERTYVVCVCMCVYTHSIYKCIYLYMIMPSDNSYAKLTKRYVIFVYLRCVDRIIHIWYTYNFNWLCVICTHTHLQYFFLLFFFFFFFW